MGIERKLILEIDPNFNNWTQLDFFIKEFAQWESDPAEPPSSGAFLCAANSNNLAAGCAAFFATSGEKHLPFEQCIRQFKTVTFNNIFFKSGKKYGFGHPVFTQDIRVEKFFDCFDVFGQLAHARKYVEEKQTPCLNFAGLYGLWCAENRLDERAAILPLLSRLIDLVGNYRYHNKLPSTYDSIKIGSVS